MAARPRLSATDRKIYCEIFIDLDDDGNGWLSREELKIGLNRLGYRMTDQQAEKLFRQMDDNEDGKITLDEFLAVMDHIETNDQSLFRQAQLRRALTEKSEDGMLDEEEIESCLEKSGVDIVKEKLQTIVTTLEKDAAGKVVIEDFLRHFRI